jgi:hypothetical protein
MDRVVTLGGDQGVALLYSKPCGDDVTALQWLIILTCAATASANCSRQPSMKSILIRLQKDGARSTQHYEYDNMGIVDCFSSFPMPYTARRGAGGQSIRQF